MDGDVFAVFELDVAVVQQRIEQNRLVFFQQVFFLVDPQLQLAGQHIAELIHILVNIHHLYFAAGGGLNADHFGVAVGGDPADVDAHHRRALRRFQEAGGTLEDRHFFAQRQQVAG